MIIQTVQNADETISNDNAQGARDLLQEFIAAQDMFSPEEAARILRQCIEMGTPVIL